MEEEAQRKSAFQPPTLLVPGSEPPVTPASSAPTAAPRPIEIGGPPGLEPTRYGDWERNGRCIDF